MREKVCLVCDWMNGELTGLFSHHDDLLSLPETQLHILLCVRETMIIHIGTWTEKGNWRRDTDNQRRWWRSKASSDPYASMFSAAASIQSDSAEKNVVWS
ncbi:uncharacterized protein LOC111884668 isoform X2 [Lactuca sativa]|uniref:uncharacterized protein LOC111884668 isoform X2 n=1 Tax=Lactuca sativa TaxID=4236 RepID=UPI0022B03D4A|nr:uncharacterized protein LOC111884668 isoform X2 [Lactuca sativa]